jgi:hypothetical protein
LTNCAIAPNDGHTSQQSIREMRISSCAMLPAVLRNCLRAAKNRFEASIGFAKT